MRKCSLGIGVATGWLCMLMSAGCARDDGSSRIVEFTSDADCEVISFHDFDVGSFGPDKRWVTSRGACSLLFFKFEELGEELIYFHRYSDGDNLKINLDGDLFMVNGVVRAIIIDDLENSNFRDWFTAATDTEIAGVGFLFVDEEIADHFKSEIQEIQQANQMLLYEEDNEPEGYIDSEFLILPEDFETLERFAPFLGEQTKVLILTDSLEDESAGHYLRFFNDHPNIRPERLFVMEPDRVDQEFLDLFKDVKTLSYGFFIKDGKVPDLSKFKNLEDLYVNLGSSELDVAQLPTPEKLRSLSIFGEWSDVKNPERLDNLEHLIPGEISGEELATILPMFPNLISLNLRQTILQDLSVLQAAPQLQVLVLGISDKNREIDLNPLKHLKNLKYLGLPNSVLEDPDLVKEFREACPQCYIIHKETFSICLGSGWLTLFLPLIGLAFLLKSHRPQQPE